MSRNERTLDLLRHLASRPGHDEVKADFRQLLIEEFGVELADVRFEQRIEVRSRTDALIGRTIFEAKSHLDKEWRDVEAKMPDYLANREAEEKERFVGIASDGLKWAVFELSDGKLVTIKQEILDPDRPVDFIAFLDGALALKKQLPPDPLTVRVELGGDSVAFRRATEAMAGLWARVKDEPAVVLKRQLWAQLLKLVYGKEVESDTLFFQHTFLVVVAKAIALAVLGLRESEPRRVLSGEAFAAAGIYGAVESDFFDWIVADAAGEDLVRRIVAHVRRFRLDEVESDVLKVIYESLIDRSERHGLGEYYTPDWLAAKVVRRAVGAPLEQRVLDPACGSGTFLFHAIRNFLAEAEEAGLEEQHRAEEATSHIAGLDIHPVAVIIARVTYLLALAPAIAKRAGDLFIPVYLGDAMQLSTTGSDMLGKELTIVVPPPPGAKNGDNGMIGEKRAAMKFPELLCKEIRLFDKLVARMQQGSEQGQTRPQMVPVFRLEIERHYKRDILPKEIEAIGDLAETYVVFDDLRRSGRDSVWTYVARNLSRPLALSFGVGWAHVVVGNPPWVAFRHMSADLQKRFRELAKGEKVHVGGKFATQNDLAALFTVRAAALYLRAGGRLAFVLPLAALTRGQFERLRSGSFISARIQWDEAWTMNDNLQPLFPVPSCVLFGRRQRTSRPLPETVTTFSGTLPLRDAPEDVADKRLEKIEGAPKPAEGTFTGGSVYREAFRNGATLYPRMLCLVERAPVGRLGMNPAAPRVLSRRRGQEKEPWKDLPSIEANVEKEFLHVILLGESILPYRAFRQYEGVVPVTHKGVMLHAKAAADRGWSGLHTWMKAAEQLWNEHRTSADNLAQQYNHHSKLAAQFPLAPLRVVYAKAGTLPAACVLRDATAIVDHKLYWARPANEDEAHYLSALLNSETARARIAAYQSRGQWGARDFDKVIFNLPIPPFNAKKQLHADLAAAAGEAEAVAAAVALPEGVKFQRARGLVRKALIEAGVAPRIEALVARLLDGE